jgi:methylmalonyl-CoA mutase C-terminal domain/subunit
MDNKADKIRILLTKPDLDDHDRGIRQVASGLREAGFEVIFTRFRFPEEIQKTAMDEDVHMIGISFLSGAHMYISSELMRLLRESNCEDIPVILGGVIPDDDISQLYNIGVRKVFGPGSFVKDIVAYVMNCLGTKR